MTIVSPSLISVLVEASVFIPTCSYSCSRQLTHSASIQALQLFYEFTHFLFIFRLQPFPAAKPDRKYTPHRRLMH